MTSNTSTTDPSSAARSSSGAAARTAVADSPEPITSTRQAAFTVPGLDQQTGAELASMLQQRLVALVDLSLTLQHIHWNVVGPNFIAVHQMLDPQYERVVPMIDDLAERIATLGGTPSALPGRLVDQRSWDDYELDRADALAHLGALDLVYSGVIGEHRRAIEAIGDRDRISEDLLIGQAAVLERHQWFVRSHLADWAGGMANAGATTEIDAARSVAAKGRRQVEGSRSPAR